MHEKMQGYRFQIVWHIQYCPVKDQSRYIKTQCCQYFAMPSLSTGHIQHTGCQAVGARCSISLMNKGFCFFFIPFKIEFMIKRRIEPVFIPLLVWHTSFI